MDAPAQGRLWAQVKTAPAGNRGLATTNPSKEHFVTTAPQSTPRTCAVDGCDNLRDGGKLRCSMHHMRRLRGISDDAPARIVGNLEVRFWQKVRPAPAEECWEWTGSTNRGYGHINIDGKPHKAHRVAYEMLRVEIPAGLHIDHLCTNKLCVNPWHLEPVTSAENTRRGDHVEETECRNGHPITPENARTDSRGWRVCRVCERIRDRAKHARRKARDA